MAILMMAPEKTQHRQRLRNLLRGIPARQLEEWSARIAGHLANWLPAGTGPVAVFAALPGEVDLSFLVARLAGRVPVYPVVRGDALTFHAVTDPATLRRSAGGILEPDPAFHPATPLDRIGVFLCPGLGFAADGVRLGRGKGYYDRVLVAARPESPRVGVGFAVQFTPSLPSDPHDQRMSHLADEHGVRSIRPAAPGMAQ